MIDANLVRLVADAAMIRAGSTGSPQAGSTGSPRAGDLVIEIGPGTGTLTEELLSRGGDVLAVEIDRHLAALLRRRFQSAGNFRLIEGDALASKHALNPQLSGAIADAKSQGRTVRLAANLPYNIASPLLVELLIAGVELLVFTVQKEVADRLRASTGSADYGPLSVMVQLLATVDVLRTMAPQVFWPTPKVDSALVRLNHCDRLGGRAAGFGRFVHRVFASRRKTLRKALLLAKLDAEKLLGQTGISPQIRPEDLSPEDCLRLFDAAG
jgi:16S rRNA (adenine1518-N6/adenine1519-N6)-dimethyltransferase